MYVGVKHLSYTQHVPSELHETRFIPRTDPRTAEILTVNLLLLKLGLEWVSYELIYLLLFFSTLSTDHSTQVEDSG